MHAIVVAHFLRRQGNLIVAPVKASATTIQKKLVEVRVHI